MQLTKTDEFLWARIEPEPMSGCWIWIGDRSRYGYGRLTWQKNKRRTYRHVHQLFYQAFRDPVPDGLELDHLCRLPACCNPWHLQAVTHQENVLRGNSCAAKDSRATHCPQGHPYDTVNTLRRKNGARICRTCSRCRCRDYYRRTYRRVRPFIALVVFVFALIGCSGAMGPRPVAAYLCPPRPPLVDAEQRVTEAGLRWLGACLEAARLNCLQLRVLRDEDPTVCEETLR